MIKVKNRLIDTDIIIILEAIKKELTNGKLNSFRRTSSGIKVTCPVHSDGQEKNESCFINDEGIWHCFTCGSKGKFESFVAACFDSTIELGEEWLLERFSNIFIKQSLNLLPINLNTLQFDHLNEEILNTFQNYHPYMTQRKLTTEIIKKFQIKYDAETKSLVFPVWDEQGTLKLLTRRSVLSKTFIIDKDKEKPIYLLNYIRQEKIKTVFVTEGQLDALTLWSWDYPAISLIGLGTKYQYEILAKSGIRIYNLCFDGDIAGDRAAQKFIKNLKNKGALINIIKLPRGKDVNDLTKEEFEKLMFTL